MAKRFAYRTAIAGLTTLALTASAIAAPQNVAFADPTGPAPVATGTNAETYAPEAKQDVKVAFGAEAPAAKDLIANADQLPAGTTFDVIPAIDTTQPGTKNATVLVTYPDGSYESVTVNVKVEDKKTRNESLVIDGGIGLGISLATLLFSQIQIPGLKEANTQIQQKLGIHNPQLAGTAEKAVGVIGGLAGLAGVILSLITLVDGFQGKGVVGKIDPKTGTQDEVRSFEWPKNSSSNKPAQPNNENSSAN